SDEVGFRRYRNRDLMLLGAWSLVELLWYRPLTAVWRISATVLVVTGRRPGWGTSPRGHECPRTKARRKNRTRGWRLRDSFPHAQRGAGRPRIGPLGRVLRHQSGTRVGRSGRTFREPAQRLLAAASRRGLHAAHVRAARAVRLTRAGDRPDERGLPHDEGVRRPAPRRLRRFGRPSRAAGPHAVAARARVRRQGGLSPRVR